MDVVLQQALNALSLGGTYALLALGLALVFSILGLINFAHGELLTISAYSVLGLHRMGAPWWVQALAALVVGPLAAIAMERVAFRRVRSASPTTLLLTSFGLSIVIQAAFLIAISPRPQAIPQPGWLQRSVEVAGLSLQAQQLLTITVTAAALAGLSWVLGRTLLGTAMRAAAEDFDAARLMGVRADRVIQGAFAASGLLAGLATILLLARRGSVDPHLGLLPVLKAFVANVIGGVGSLPGAVLGGLLLGVAETAMRAYLPQGAAGFTDGLLFLGVVAILTWRPRGILGRPEAVRV